MTLADVVFPLFLFIVGVSIPLALERARDAGKPVWAQLGHILFRTAGLLILGLVEFNSDADRRLGDRSGACLPSPPRSWRGALYLASVRGNGPS